MKDEKRNVRTYKIKDTVYFKAVENSKDTHLSTRIEELVTAIAEGKEVVVKKSPKQ